MQILKYALQMLLLQSIKISGAIHARFQYHVDLAVRTTSTCFNPKRSGFSTVTNQYAEYESRKTMYETYQTIPSIIILNPNLSIYCFRGKLIFVLHIPCLVKIYRSEY